MWLGKKIRNCGEMCFRRWWSYPRGKDDFSRCPSQIIHSFWRDILLTRVWRTEQGPQPNVLILDSLLDRVNCCPGIWAEKLIKRSVDCWTTDATVVCMSTISKYCSGARDNLVGDVFFSDREGPLRFFISSSTICNVKRSWCTDGRCKAILIGPDDVYVPILRRTSRSPRCSNGFVGRTGKRERDF